jgi:hypothetical protein
MGEDRMTTVFESGYYTAAQIPVTKDLLCGGSGIFHFQQIHPFASFAQITGEDGRTFAIDCTGNADGALLSVATPEKSFVKILLPLDTPAGLYQYRAYFYGENSNEVIYQHDGTIVVDDSQKVDCGCHTLGSVPPAPIDSGDQQNFEDEWEAHRAGQ